MPDLTPAQQIAHFTAGLRFDDISASVLNRAKLHILDCIGLGLAAPVEDFGKSTVTGIAAMADGGSCTVIGRPERFGPRNAALVNGVLVHGLDFDDTHLASIIHPTSTALPVSCPLDSTGHPPPNFPLNG